ncbi:MAG: hypothetical protein ACYCW6_17870 [Candidatus Xenobia bacterium]
MDNHHSPRLDGRTILLLEQDPMVRAVIRRTLERVGALVLEARTVDEACLAATMQSIHLLLADTAAVGSGISLSSQVPVLFLCASLPPGTSPPPGPMLLKPFSPTQLVKHVRVALDHEAS